MIKLRYFLAGMLAGWWLRTLFEYWWRIDRLTTAIGLSMHRASTRPSSREV